LAVALAAVSLLAMIALSTVGMLPEASATGAGVVAWFQANADYVRRYVWVSTVGAPLTAAIGASLRRYLPEPHRDVFLIGIVSLTVAVAVQSWFLGGLALHAGTMEPATARTLLDVAIFFGPVLTGAFMTMTAPVALVALRGDGRLPIWLGVLGAIVFAEQAIETVTIFGSNGFTEPGGAMNMQLGAALTMGWLLAFAIWAGLRERRGGPA
jgi:hypothetical protein